MTLQEAIEALAIFRQQEAHLLGGEFAQAAQLGIEALKCIEGIRSGRGSFNTLLLPGETKE